MALPVTIPFGMLPLALFRTPMDLYATFSLFSPTMIRQYVENDARVELARRNV